VETCLTFVLVNSIEIDQDKQTCLLSQDSVEHILLPKAQPCIFEHYSQNQTANMCAHTMARRAACTCAVQRLGSVSVGPSEHYYKGEAMSMPMAMSKWLCLRLWLLYIGYAMVWLRPWLRPWLWLWRSMRSMRSMSSLRSMRSMHGSCIFCNRGALADCTTRPMSCVKASQPSWHVSTVEQNWRVDTRAHGLCVLCVLCCMSGASCLR
jgi:hypothetical protein